MKDMFESGGFRVNSRPLNGVKVIDLSSVIMGPYATQILGDLGADVVGVEAFAGNSVRRLSRGPHPEFSGIALNVLRNKRSLCIDLKSPEGSDVLARLVASADILVTNLRPAPLRRLGMTYDVAQELNDRIIFCQATGFPSDSDEADAPAYDDVIQAASGMAGAHTLTYGAPTLPPTLVADKVTAYHIVAPVLAALFDRERTGRGQYITVSMIEALTGFMMLEHGADAIAEPPQGPPGYPRSLTVHRGPVETADGWYAVLPYTPLQFQQVFLEFDRIDLANDPRAHFGQQTVPAESFAFLYGNLRQLATQRTTAEWIAICEHYQIPHGPVRSLQEVVETLPLTEHENLGRYRVTPTGYRTGTSSSCPVWRSAPFLGQDTRRVLQELGFDKNTVKDWLQRGVAFAAEVNSGPEAPGRGSPCQRNAS